jgi:hypothetical protein
VGLLSLAYFHLSHSSKHYTTIGHEEEKGVILNVNAPEEEALCAKR